MSGFSLYPRKRKIGKPVFYVQFKKTDGSYSTAKSTKQTTRRRAQEWAEMYLFKNGTPMPGQDVILEKDNLESFAFYGMKKPDENERTHKKFFKWA